MMMSKINDGGAAFPGHGNGMTLRDYFAAKAMQGVLASEWVMREIEREARGSHDGKMIPLIVAEAYRLSDAMLAERDKGRDA